MFYKIEKNNKNGKYTQVFYIIQKYDSAVCHKL